MVAESGPSTQSQLSRPVGTGAQVQQPEPGCHNSPDSQRCLSLLSFRRVDGMGNVVPTVTDERCVSWKSLEECIGTVRGRSNLYFGQATTLNIQV